MPPQTLAVRLLDALRAVTKRRATAISVALTVIASVFAFAVVFPSPASGNHLNDQMVLTVDSGGADDWTNPHRNDLGLLGYADDGSGTVQVAWSLDDTQGDGGNTTKGCALFDTDGDGNVNYALCTSLVDGADGSGILSEPVLYECADSKADTCGRSGGESIIPFTGTCDLGIIEDPFASDPVHSTVAGQTAPDPVLDSFVVCDLPLSDIGSPDSYQLLNVCTYTSDEQNAAAKDCVVPVGAGYLVVQKVAEGETEFPFAVDGVIVAGLSTTAEFSLAGGESTEALAVDTTSTINVVEGDVEGWSLDAVSCVNDADPTDADSDGLDLAIDPGERWTCTFTNSRSVIAPITRVIKGAEDGNDTVATVNEPGDSVTINVTIYNDAEAGVGDATLTSLTDEPYGDITSIGGDITATTCEIGVEIAGGGFYSCSFTVDVTGEPGTYDDTVTAALSNDAAQNVLDSDAANVVIADVAGVPLLIEKSVTSVGSLPEPGGDFEFQVVVTNPSGVDTATVTDLDDTYLADLQDSGLCSDADGDTEAPFELSPGESLTCVFTVTHTGNPDTFTNDVTVTATDDDGAVVGGVSNEVTVEVTDTPSSIEVTKSADPSEVAEPGGLVTYTVMVENTSPVDVVTITEVLDPRLGGDISASCTPMLPVDLGPGEKTTCVVADVEVSGNAGDEIVNTASASGTDDQGNPVDDTGQATVTITGSDPEIAVTKTADQAEVFAPGEDVTFTVVITNNSNASDPVTVTELGDDIHTDAVCLDSEDVDAVGQTIEPGTSLTCSFTAFVDGDETDTVTVKVEDDDGTETSNSGSATVYMINPSVDIEKSTNGEDADDAPGPSILVGGSVTWTYEVTNNGDVDLAGIVVTDDMLGDVCTIESLPVGESTTCTETGTAAAGQYANTGTADVSYTDADSDIAERTDDDDSHYYGVEASLDVTKSGPAYVEVTGDDDSIEVVFEIVVENTGDVALVDAVLNDDAAVDCNPDLEGDQDLTGVTIEPGESVTCTATVTATVNDDGTWSGVDNTAEVCATTAIGGQVCDDDDATVELAGVTVSKKVVALDHVGNTVGDPVDELTVTSGTNVAWVITITNIGSVDVTYDLTDPNATDCEESGVTLAAGATTAPITCYVIGITDDTVNTATVTATPDGAAEALDDVSDDASVTVINPELSVTKSGPDYVEVAGDDTGIEVVFEIVVANTGDVDLTDAVLTDDGAVIDCDPDVDGNQGLPAVLAAGDSVTCTATVAAMVNDDETWANVYNTAEVCATNELGGQVCDDDDATVELAGVTVSKKVGPSQTGPWSDTLDVASGDTVYWQVTITNIGSVALPSVDVVDDHNPDCAVSGASLDAGESITVVCSETARYSETGVVNTAVVTGCVEFDDTGACVVEVTDSDSAAYNALYNGFTPGFWKNHDRGRNNMWDGDLACNGTPMTKDVTFGDLFGDTFDDYDIDVTVTIGKGKWKKEIRIISISDLSVYNALSLRGGDDYNGSLEILLRAASASLLNSCYHQTLGNEIGDIDDVWPITIEDWQELIVAALEADSRSANLDLAGTFDGWNNGLHDIDWDFWR